MNRLIPAIVVFLSGLLWQGWALGQDSPAETAKAFIREGDYNNAILVLNRAISTDRNNIELKKDLAFAYYLQKNYGKGIETIKPVVESSRADIQSFQLLGMMYKATDNGREAEKLYKSGLKKFPASGALYNEYGEVLWAGQDFTGAAKQWQKGIQSDPNHSGNYYNAAKYFYMSADKVTGLIYGEIFVNLESYSKRTPEIKTLLLEGYKKLFAEPDMLKGQDTNNEFIKAYLDVMKNHSRVVAKGINADVLSALRTRFILEWFDKHAARFPFRLFDLQRQLAREGMFDAYNQWIFGAAGNLARFQQWTVNHSEAYDKFITFQKSRVLKLPEGQFYFKP